MNKERGFTLLEVMVSVSLMAILTTVAAFSFNESRAQARDAERKADLRNMESALALYKQKYGRYPESCLVTAADAGFEFAWLGTVRAGEIGSPHECPGGSAQYVVNDLSNTPEVENLYPQFIPTLPTDPRPSGGGYVYVTNPAGTVYKFMALDTVESEVVSNGNDGLGPPNEFARCGTISSVCVRPTSPSGGAAVTTDSQCTTPAQYSNDYAVWGGFAPGGGSFYRDTERAKEFYTDRIRCN